MQEAMMLFFQWALGVMMLVWVVYAAWIMLSTLYDAVFNKGYRAGWRDGWDDANKKFDATWRS